MEFAIYYTLGGIVLYSATAWILDYIEQSRGARLPYRNYIYFVIFFLLAYLMMNVINPPPDPEVFNTTTEAPPIP